jgi:Uma2 family endonuclease
VSPSNTPSELEEKRALYFEAGAEEVWQCQADGMMVFYLKDDPNTVMSQSSACPDFPAQF